MKCCMVCRRETAQAGTGGAYQVSLVLQWFWLCLDVWLRGKRKDVHNKCCLRWFSHLAKSERFDLYNCFKNILERERYLEVIQGRVYKTALARFRVGVSRINDHRLRFSVADNNDSALFV